MAELIDLKELEERVILIAVSTSDEDDTRQSLDELEELADTAGAVTVDKIVQNRERIHPGTYLGKGKLQELREMLYETGATGVICDDELSPAQLKNLEDILDTKVMDRTMVILDIFAARANTREGKIQVELAQLKYRAIRLVGMRSSLSRLGGGIGTRGPGEKKLETDRRLIHQRIGQLKKELEDVKRHREVTRQQRGKDHALTAAIVGYTNAGKSTLLNTLTGASVLSEDKLFATLDPTTRLLTLDDGQQLLLTDTVGFIRKLPTELVESFKSTLDEVREADILIHVVDISHPSFEDHIASVNRTLSEIGAADKPTIMVFNKIDAYQGESGQPDVLMPGEEPKVPLAELEKTWMGKTGPDTVFISARNRENVETLRKLIYERAAEIHMKRFPYNDFLFEYFSEEGEPEQK